MLRCTREWNRQKSVPLSLYFGRKTDTKTNRTQPIRGIDAQPGSVSVKRPHMTQKKCRLTMGTRNAGVKGPSEQTWTEAEELGKLGCVFKNFLSGMGSHHRVLNRGKARTCLGFKKVIFPPLLRICSRW